MEPVGCA